MKLEKKQHYVNYLRYHDLRGIAICDGMTEPMGMNQVFYMLFVVSGLMVFIWCTYHWEWFAEKIQRMRGKRE